jgi:hypothetical protein
MPLWATDDGEKSMHRIISVYGRKIFSVSLIFNALLTITCLAGLLYGFYFENWAIYAPYLINGNILWLVIAAAVINIFPSAYVGKVHTGRLWFHHYVYGFLVIIASIIWIVVFTPVSLLTIFFINTTNISVNVGRFFFLGGLTLVLDDLPDVHRVTFYGLRWLKRRAHEARRVIDAAQFILGFVTVYLFIAVSLSIIAKPQWMTAANFIQMGTVLVTAFTCFASVKRKVWHKLDPKQESTHHQHD